METGGIPWANSEPAADELIQRASTTCTYCWNRGRRPEQLQGVKKHRAAGRYAPSIREDELHFSMGGGRPALLILVCWSCGNREVVVVNLLLSTDSGVGTTSPQGVPAPLRRVGPAPEGRGRAP